MFTVFTTRCDTLFGATYCVMAPEHPYVEEITTDAQKADVEAYKESCASTVSYTHLTLPTKIKQVSLLELMLSIL